MTTMRWLETGRSARGAPSERGAFARRSLFLLVLAAVSLAETGCQSGFFGLCGSSPCGASPCGSSPCGGHLTRLRERIFNRRTSTYYGAVPTLGAEAPLEASPAVVSPAPTITTPGSVPVLTPSAPAEAPTDLSPLPPEEKTPTATPGPPGGETGSTKPSGNRANYEATGARNRLGRARSDSLTRTLVTTSEPASRSARGADPIPSTTESSDPSLENLPPVEVPREWNTDESPVADLTKESAKAESAKAVPVPPLETTTEAASETPKEETSTTAPAEVSVVPGIRHFQVVEPKLAGGSLPTATGLDWLAEKGYKTILDLRDTNDVQPSFIEEVTKRGMRYMILPVGLNQVDSNHISRFNEDLALSDARPLYFCDADGTRAGVLWYIRRLTVDKYDASAASREAETLGLSDKAYWQAATKYLESLNPSTTPKPEAPTPTPNPPAPTSAVPPAARSVNAEPPKSEEPAPAAASKIEEEPKVEKASAGAPATATELASQSSEQPNSGQAQPRDPTAWHSYAALVVTGLGVPLAYWSRTALPSLRILSRASLPAPRRRSKSIPVALGDGK